MAQSVVFNGQTIYIPGAYVSVTVQNSVAGISSTGVLMAVGEALMGPDYSLETDPANVTYGPDQQADVVAKYGSGPLVDAFRGAVAAANDPQLNGSFTRMVLVKTNAATKASGPISKLGGGTYGTFYDTSYGKAGNFINYTITQKTAEAAPTTAPFTFLLPIAGIDLSLRTDGGTIRTYTVGTLETPAVFAAGINALTDVAATGGTSRGLLGAAAGNLTLDLGTGTNTVIITRSQVWSGQPVAGDTVYIPTGSVIVGAGNANRGSYVVTSATTTTINATKLRDASGGTPDIVTAPVAVAVQAVVATTDVQGWAPVTITADTVTQVPGKGRSMEINELITAVDLLSRYCYSLNTTPVKWISKAAAPYTIPAAAEYGVTTVVNSQTSGITQTFDTPGQVAFRMGYTGTTCSVVITDTTLTTTITGGSGSNLSVTLADFNSIGNLATYINSQTGYNATVENAALGQLSATLLDNITGLAVTALGAPSLRVKIDGYDYFMSVLNNTSLVQLGNPAVRVEPGLPAATAITFMNGGTKGSTSDAQVQAAIDYCETLQGNFLIPLFSQDATLDIAAGLTDPASTYTIDAINAYARAHVIKMSTIKRRRNRQAFLSREGTFAAQKNAASNIASARCSMTFQDMKDVALTGIVQYQPWMGAIKAAGMQAAGFYRSIFNKGINCTGILQAAGDYKASLDTDVENALLAGLLPAKQRETGGFTWISDQTTYTLNDNNFVFNSIQAMYAADTVALTIAKDLELAFLGQSLADVSAALMLSALEGIMYNLLRLKLIAPSDGFPAGFKDAFIKINGPVALVNATVFLATALFFIPISVQVEQVQSTAGA